MTNMGVSDLLLIAPKCEITYEAQLAAATGQGPLQKRTVYNSWEAFFESEPDGFRLALSARDGRGRPLWTMSDALTKIRDRQQASDLRPLYLVFGPEDCGLSNFDVDQCHLSVVLPTFGENTSLNLAQAVMLATFMVRSWQNASPTMVPLRKVEKSEPFPDHALRAWLEALGFSLDDRRIQAFSVLKRLLLHSLPTAQETRVLEATLWQSARKLEELNEIRRTLFSSSLLNPNGEKSSLIPPTSSVPNHEAR